jgi:fructokinase
VTATEASTRRARVLCLGDARVDLVCERWVSDVSQADGFVPRLGGAAAAVAVTAARLGAPVAFAGGAGDDPWGRWLRDRLSQAGVDVGCFGLAKGIQTMLALVAVAPGGRPRCTLYGDGSSAASDAVDGALDEATALFVNSSTLVGSAEREVTMRARERALAAGIPIVFDPNVRAGRWRSQADAAASANACVPGALLVRAGQDEAAILTGEDDPERAAQALVKAGARLVVVTLGPEGAILRGELRADVEGVPAEVVSTRGAGDVFTGTLLARLALSDFYPPAVAASLREAVAAGARACERWGAVE